MTWSGKETRRWQDPASKLSEKMQTDIKMGPGNCENDFTGASAKMELTSILFVYFVQ